MNTFPKPRRLRNKAGILFFPELFSFLLSSFQRFSRWVVLDIFNIDLKVDLNEDIRIYKKHIVSVYNIQNDLSNIDEYRGQYSKQVSQILYNFSKRYNGPQIEGCLCKSRVVNKFIDDFWLWFDELQNDIQKEEK